MVTCYLRYEIDPYQLDAFERFARRWIDLVNRSGGTHHGYFLPLEGASDVAVALFSFPSLADYERDGERFGVDPESSRPTASAKRRAACVATSAASCARSSPATDPDARG